MPESTPVVTPTLKPGEAVLPLPDPSPRVTEAMWRETGHLKELVGVQVEEIKRGIDIAHDDLVRWPTEVERQVMALKELHGARFQAASDFLMALKEFFESKFNGVRDYVDLKMAATSLDVKGIKQYVDVKFEGIEKQFLERDVRVEQAATQTKVAVDAALQAAEKAVGKANESFALSIDKSDQQTTKQIDAQSKYIDDVKERLTKLEAFALGLASADAKNTGESDRSTHNNQWMIGVAVVIGLAILGYILKH